MFLVIFLSKMRWSVFLIHGGYVLYRFVTSNVTMTMSGSVLQENKNIIVKEADRGKHEVSLNKTYYRTKIIHTCFDPLRGHKRQQ